MMEFLSAKDIAEKWNISKRRVSTLCRQKRIEGAAMVGNMWIIPCNAEKPVDKRAMRSDRICEKALKPFVKWAGGKGQLLGELEKLMSTGEEKKFCEPMVGGGALLFYALSNFDYKQFYISDINAELINAYKVIQNNVESLIETLREMQTSYYNFDVSGRKDYYYSVRDEFNKLRLSESTKIKKAANFIFLNKTCFNGLYRVNRKGQFNVPVGNYKKPAICDEANLRNVNRALQKVTIVCGDYTLSKKFIDKDTFVYLDPPYRPLSETSAFTSYNTDAFDDDEQLRLAQFISEINASGAKIVLSNSDPQNINPDDTFFDELYKSYNIKRVSATRMINSKAECRGKINELLIYN